MREVNDLKALLQQVLKELAEARKEREGILNALKLQSQQITDIESRLREVMKGEADKNAEILLKISADGEENEKHLQALRENIASSEASIIESFNAQSKATIENSNTLLKDISSKINIQYTDFAAYTGEIKSICRKTERISSEAVWAEIFNNTITDSTWLKNKTFSPGRWAAGYQMLYVMYRVLNEMRPQSILELGLGQTTRMIAQYAAEHKDVRHTVVEHDSNWIEFFKNSYNIPCNTSIVQLDREFVPYKEAETVRVFKDFSRTFGNEKFDFILVDAPLGGDMKEYARIDVLSIIPECLCSNFAILLDDSDRIGEHRTLAEIERVLRENNIEYVRGNYCGNKDSVILCSASNNFLATL